MLPVQERSAFRVAALLAAISFGLLAFGSEAWMMAHAAGEASPKPAAEPASAEAKPKEGECCPAGDMTLPLELISKYPPGQLHSPYQDHAELAKNKELVKQFRLPGCNECHGGGGGGGSVLALSQGVWFWGNTDDVLFRLIALGSKGLEAQGLRDATNLAASRRQCRRWRSPSRARTSSGRSSPSSGRSIRLEPILPRR